MSTARIASIYFAPVHAERAAYAGYYKIPAVPKGNPPVILTLDDKVERSQGAWSLSPIGGRRAQFTHLVTAHEIAVDLVTNWTAQGLGMTPQCHPGIWAVRDRVPLMSAEGIQEFDAEQKPIWRDATPEEAKEMFAEDERANRLADASYAEYLIVTADEVAADTEHPGRLRFIAENAKLAAKHYGIDRDWIRDLTTADSKKCPGCTKVVPAVAAICPHCGWVIDAEAYAKNELLKTAALQSARAAAKSQSAA